MKKRNQLMKYNLQYFADGGEGGDGADDNTGDGDDDQDDEQDDDDADAKSKKSGKKGKYLTQEDIDDIITKRLERDRKTREKKQKAKDNKKDDKQGDKDSDDKSDESNKKLSALEMKVLCYDHDIAKEYAKEAIALANAYVDEDTDIDEALEMVTEKFPQFVKGYKADKDQDDDDQDDEDKKNKGSWGQRQKKEAKKTKTLDDEIQEKLYG